LISFDIFEKQFEEFNITYDNLIKFLTSTSRRFNFDNIKENYKNFEKMHTKENSKYIVANFGSPNIRKSSAFNFLMTGSNDFPLPPLLEEPM